MDKLNSPSDGSLPKEQQLIVDKLCSDYRSNLIRRLKEQSGTEEKPFFKPPEVLGANALIAEHLHNHGYFISQSVFSSEIELPGNGRTIHEQPPFRLKQSDVEEIIEALNLSLEPTEVTALIERYYSDTKASLLSTILAKNCTGGKPNQVHSKDNSQKDLIAFNKYLKILVSRIAKVSMILTELKRKRLELIRERKSPTKSHHQHRHRRPKSGNREKNQIEDLTKKIERLTSRLTSLQNSQINGLSGVHFGGCASPKSYGDWIRELKDSRHGQKMLRKIERIIVNSLNKEQLAMQKNFDEKLDTQKMILKLHYKQKFLEHFQALNLSTEPLMKLPLRDVIGNGKSGKLTPTPVDIGAPSKRKRKNHGDSKKKSSDSSCTNNNGRLKESKEKCVANKLITKDRQVKESVEEEDGKENERKKESRDGGTILQNGEEKSVRLRNVQQLIKDAKDRIKLLQSENERLDQSFNTYLEKQSSQVAHFQKDVSAIWESYNVDKSLLEKRKNIPAVATNCRPEVLSKLVVPEIRIEKCKTNLEVGRKSQMKVVTLPSGTSDSVLLNKETDTTPSSAELAIGGGVSVAAEGQTTLPVKDNSSGEFSNPFINFDIKQFLESTAKPVTVAEKLSKSSE